MARARQRWVVATVVAAGMFLLAGGLLSCFAPPSPSSSPSPRMTGDTGTLGMVLINISDAETALFYHVDDFGVYVLAVDESSQAYRGGVRSGDRIVSANGVVLSHSSELTALCDALAPSQELVIQLVRGVGNERIMVTLLTDSNVSI